jgi:hypothetical protein
MIVTIAISYFSIPNVESGKQQLQPYEFVDRLMVFHNQDCCGGGELGLEEML